MDPDRWQQVLAKYTEVPEAAQTRRDHVFRAEPHPCDTCGRVLMEPRVIIMAVQPSHGWRRHQRKCGQCNRSITHKP